MDNDDFMPGGHFPAEVYVEISRQQDMLSAFEKWWVQLTREGDPLLIPNKFRLAFEAGWAAKTSTLVDKCEAEDWQTAEASPPPFAEKLEPVCRCGRSEHFAECCDDEDGNYDGSVEYGR